MPKTKKTWIIEFKWDMPNGEIKIRYLRGRSLTDKREDAQLLTYEDALEFITDPIARDVRKWRAISAEMVEVIVEHRSSSSSVGPKIKWPDFYDTGKVDRKDRLLQNYNEIGSQTFRPLLRRPDWLTDEIMLRRIALMAEAKAHLFNIDPPFPSSIGRPARYSITHVPMKDRLEVYTYHATYAAAQAVKLLLRDEKYKWQSPTLIVTASKRRIKCEHLEELMEYEPVGKEKLFVMPEPDFGHLSGKPLAPPRPSVDPVMSGIQSKPLPIRKDKSAPRRQVEPGDHTPSHIAHELNTTPQAVRSALRSLKISKPYVWKSDKVKDIIQAVAAKIKK